MTPMMPKTSGRKGDDRGLINDTRWAGGDRSAANIKDMAQGQGATSSANTAQSMVVGGVEHGN